MGAAKFDAWRAQAERLVDHQIRHQRADPGNGDIAVDRQNFFECTEYTQGHQQRGNQYVKNQPHHTTRVAARDAGKKIRPRQRACIGIRQVDFDLRDHHKNHRDQHRQPGVANGL